MNITNIRHCGILAIIFLMLTSACFGEEYRTIIDVQLDQPIMLYVDGNLVSSTLPLPGREDQGYSLIYPLISDTQKTVEIKIVANGYMPYVRKVVIGQEPRITIRSGDLKPLSYEYSLDEIKDTTAYLNNISTKYSDPSYVGALREAYELLDEAKQKHDEGDYDTAYRLAIEAYVKGSDIYDTWKYIDKCNNIINEYNSKGYSKYCNISKELNDMNTIKANFITGKYSDAKLLANSTYLKLKYMIDTIKYIEGINQKIDNIKNELKDEEYGLNPSKMPTSVEEYVNDSETLLKQRKFQDAKYKIELADDLLSKYEKAGKNAQNYLIKLYKIFENNDVVNQYKNINNIDYGKYNQSYANYKYAKEKYNEGEVYVSEIYAKRSYDDMIDLMKKYNETKANISNEINGVINEIDNLDLGNESIHGKIDNKSKYYVNLAKRELDNGNFTGAQKYIHLAKQNIYYIKNYLNISKQELQNTEEYIENTSKKYNNEIVLDKPKNKLNNLKSNYLEKDIPTIKNECEEIKKLTNEIVDKYLSSKKYLSKLNNTIVTVCSNENISSTILMNKYYNNVEQLHKNGDYDKSINLSKQYIEKINSTYNSIEETENYIKTHNSKTILFGLYKIKIDYSNETSMLNNAKKLLSEGKFEESMNISKTAKIQAEDKYHKTYDLGVISLLINIIDDIF